MRNDDFIYYRRRAAEEQTAAENASNLDAARAHKKLSEHYAGLAVSRGETDASDQIRANDA